MPTTTFISALHDAPGTGVIVLAGGGSRAATEMLETPGASRTVLDVRVPYAAAALEALLGGAPDRACDPATARAMAMAAFREARRLDPDQATFGVACTASLATDRTKRGDHRVHVALQTAGRTHLWSLTLEPGARTRLEEERICTDLLLTAVAEAKDVAAPGLGPLRDGERIIENRHDAREHWRALLLGDVAATGHAHAGQPDTASAPRLIFPGAFNPLHAGHLEMARFAEAEFGMPVEFEICVVNVDKPPLNYADLAERTDGFPPSAAVWLTAAPTFVEKARLFPGATFLVGIDTLVRIADPRYYGGDPAARDAAMAELARLGVHLLVFGRLHEGRFQTLADVDLPASVTVLTTGVEAEQFRRDLSSTHLRQR